MAGFFALLCFGAGETVFGLIMAVAAIVVWLGHSPGFRLSLKESAQSRPRGQPLPAPQTLFELRERALSAGAAATWRPGSGASGSPRRLSLRRWSWRGPGRGRPRAR